MCELARNIRPHLFGYVGWQCVGDEPLSSVCVWQGVDCSRVGVTGITLSMGSRTNASLPWSIGLLTTLSTLSISNSGLIHSLPTSIGYLSLLQTLDFHNNYLSGPIPSTIGSMISLTSISLGHNKLSGSLPSSMGFLNELSFLSASQNKLSGTLPSSFSNLSLLENLNLASNHLGGSIPSYFCELSVSLFLRNNNFSCYAECLQFRSGSSVDNMTVCAPVRHPTARPMSQLSTEPTHRSPVWVPTMYMYPSGQPTGQPSNQPSAEPSAWPSGQPTSQPSSQPTGRPTSRAKLPSSPPTVSSSRGLYLYIVSNVYDFVFPQVLNHRRQDQLVVPRQVNVD